jgi:methylated-DNA-protein-cysteine methyltransferase-like protein
MRRSHPEGHRPKARPGAFARTKARVVAGVAAIPEGRVTTYGAIGDRLGVTARVVARVMATLTPDESAALPWYRVVAAGGVISSMKVGAVGRRQVARLREDGVEVTARNRVADFDAVFWSPS